MRQSGLVLWFTGLSGAGKSTIAMEVEAELIGLGFSAYVLDGDNLRHGLTAGLGFGEADRHENVRRVYETAALFCDAQVITLVSLISAYAEPRLAARERIGAGRFCEIYVKADVETCKSRDPKGLYAKAISGEIADFTGVSAPYEEPENPDIIIDTREVGIDDAVKIIVGWVLERELAFWLPRILEDSIHAAFYAGQAILSVYERDFEVEYKSDKSPLTSADFMANSIIRARLMKYGRYISMLSEESADDRTRLDNKFCFIVDPLDGTKEFIKRNGEFTVNIGLAYKNRAVLGVVYAPCLNKLYYAAQGYGTFSVDLRQKVCKLFDWHSKASVSGRADDLIVVKSRSHGDGRTEALLEQNKHRIKSVADMGSSLKGCMIAEGAADVYYRFGNTMEWDTCAMQCIVEEAGGVFVQGDWSEMLYNREDSLNGLGFVILNKMESRLDV